MRKSDEIVENAKSNKEIKDYNLLEMHLYLCIEQILKMYSNRQISIEEANKRKTYATKQYEELAKQYEIESNLFSEYINNIRDTENARTKLRKLLNDTNEITEEKMCETINICLEIISTVFKGEFDEG